jgi:hypothetical protein
MPVIKPTGIYADAHQTDKDKTGHLNGIKTEAGSDARQHRGGLLEY